MWKGFDRLDLLLPVIRRVRFWLLPAIVRGFGFAATGRRTKTLVTMLVNEVRDPGLNVKLVSAVCIR
jgi:hypothetical protein